MIGELKAQEHFMNTKKGIMKLLREHSLKAVDRINPLELAAVVAATFMIKPIIHSADSFITAWSEKLKGAQQVDKALKEQGILGQVYNILKTQTAFLEPLGMPLLALVAPTPPSADLKMIEMGYVPEWMEWALCFVISYIVVRHFGQIAMAAADFSSNVLGMAKMLTAVAV